MAEEVAPAGAGGELFTRGGMDAADARGPSMVALHADKMQKEKEARALDKLRNLLPQLTAATHAVALQETGWDADAAAALLRAFSAARSDELRKLQKERKRHQKKLAERAARDAGGSSESGSGSESGSETSSSSGSSDSEDSDDGRRSGRKRSRSSKSDRRGSKKRRKEKKERKESSKRRRREKVKDRDKKRRRDKDRKRDKDKERRKNRDSDKDKARKKEFEYGKFGVIRETDYYTKRPEFTLWALEVKGADVEGMSRQTEKDLFRSYMEDYNTATLSHRKYYDLEAYEKEQAARGGGGGGGARGGERMVFDDEAERRREAAAAREREQAERLRAAYQELQTTDKAAAMREQEILRAKMALAYRTGDQKEASRIAERLKPDDK